MLSLFCGQSLQCGRSLEETVFYSEVKGECYSHNVDDLVLCFGDLDSHMGGHNDGFDGVCVRCWLAEFGRSNVTRVLLENELFVSNTLFKK